jgi:hypothetical protein
MCNNQSYRIVYMSNIMMLMAAFALLILVTNHMHIIFVTDNSKSRHDPILQNAFAQAAQSKQKPSLLSQVIAPVLLAPIATSGNNVYIVWSSNKTGNYEIMFRASSDHGQSFGNKINLSNSASESQNAEVQSSGDMVFVTWWERNSTSNEPVLRISTDNGKTFGPIFMLSFDGPINNG